MIMKRNVRCAALIAAAVVLAACSEPAADAPRSVAAGPQTAQSTGGELKLKAPDQWVVEQPTSSMRTAQYSLPRAEGDNEDGSLVIYYFGQGQGGSVQANLDRWTGQMEQPGGANSKDLARTEKITVGELSVTLLDVSGTYTAEMAPGSGTRHNKENFRLRAAVVETPRGPYFFKLVGPAKTIARWEQEFNSFVRSVEFKK
jgi:hypothetical protein